jgi:small basic protein (TIGR04137 family)
MSLDRSLKVSAGLTRSRNVLTRAERLAVLMEDERWNVDESVYGLKKVRADKVTGGKKIFVMPEADED